MAFYKLNTNLSNKVDLGVHANSASVYYNINNTLTHFNNGVYVKVLNLEDSSKVRLFRAADDVISLADLNPNVTSSAKWTIRPSVVNKATSAITRSGTTFTGTRVDGTTYTFTQQDNNTTYAVATTAANGLLKKLNGSTVNYMRGDGNWATPPNTNTTYANATSTAAGLMTAAQFNKLSAIANSATNGLKGFTTNSIDVTIGTLSSGSYVTKTATITKPSGYTNCIINGYYVSGSNSNTWLHIYRISHNQTTLTVSVSNHHSSISTSADTKVTVYLAWVS